MGRPIKIATASALLNFLTEHGMGDPTPAVYRGVEFVLTTTGTEKAIVIEDVVGSIFFNTTLSSRLHAIRDLDQLADLIGGRR